jgi:hypothetical protein
MIFMVDHMPNLNQLVGQPQSDSPPEQQGTSGTADNSSLQSLMGQKQGGGGAPMAPPSHHETVAILDHISAYDRRWRELLEDPDIGVTSVRKHIYDIMADLMNDDYATLPQTLQLLKSFPTEPLEQKQWLEQHIQTDEQAMRAVLDHHAQGMPPPGSFEQEMAAQGEAPAERSELVKGAMARYKKHPKKGGGGGLPSFQYGGRPQVGQPSLVGEQGPEIFMPDRPGTITPNPVTTPTQPQTQLMQGGFFQPQSQGNNFDPQNLQRLQQIPEFQQLMQHLMPRQNA